MRLKPKLFYCTFGQKYAYIKHPTYGDKIHPDGVVGIMAKNIQEARGYAFKEFEQYFCTIYYPSQLDMSLFPLGVLFTIGETQ